MYTGRTLHILNGDATLEVFMRTTLKDEHHAVWREMMCEGPVSDYLHDPAFWKRREEYICKRYGEKPEAYFDKVVLEQIRLDAFLDDYSEIILWFEHDLFCQINLMAILAWLTQRNLRGTIVSVVSINHHPEIANFKGLGQLSPRQLHQLLGQKQELTKDDLQFARQIWRLYCQADPRELEATISEIPSSFPFLGAALKAHLQLLPNKNTGLNVIDQKILELASQQSLTKFELMRQLLEWDNIYGFGDTQLLAIINRLRPILQQLDTVVPTFEAIQALEGKLNVGRYLTEPLLAGGASPTYKWDDELEQVASIS